MRRSSLPRSNPARLHRYDEALTAIDLLEQMLPAPPLAHHSLPEIDPTWGPLHEHPCFQALLERYADDVEH